MANIFTRNPRLLKSAVFGANDGIITTFAVVAGVAGANLPTDVVLILGVGSMVADAISMGLGDYLGEKSERRLRKKKGERVSSKKLWKTSLVTFTAFVFAGCFPLMPYILNMLGLFETSELFIASTLFTLIALFLIGSSRTLITGGLWWKRGLEMLGVGAIAAAAAYILGAVIKSLI